MKKLFLLLLLGLGLSACSNDFDVTAPWKEIPVVYGILSPQDTAHYIRIEKAFLDPERSSLQIAQIVDSLYYPADAIAVWLELASNPNTRVQLQRVDGGLEGYPRTEGIFAGSPNWLYKFKQDPNFQMQTGKVYKLVIKRNDGKEDITAETTIPATFTLVKPFLGDPVPNISFAGSVATPIRWRSDENAYFFNLTFRIRINERNLNGTLAQSYTLVWEAAKNIKRALDVPAQNGLYEANTAISGNSFYNFLAQHLQRPPANRYRQFAGCDIIIDGGGKEIQEFLETVAANSGLTGAEVFPNYSNISEGYGVFTAKNRTLAENVRINALTVDSMNMNPIADTLGFIN